MYEGISTDITLAGMEARLAPLALCMPALKRELLRGKPPRPVLLLRGHPKEERPAALSLIRCPSRCAASIFSTDAPVSVTTTGSAMTP